MASIRDTGVEFHTSYLRVNERTAFPFPAFHKVAGPHLLTLSHLEVLSVPPERETKQPLKTPVENESPGLTSSAVAAYFFKWSQLLFLGLKRPLYPIWTPTWQ